MCGQWCVSPRFDLIHSDTPFIFFALFMINRECVLCTILYIIVLMVGCILFTVRPSGDDNHIIIVGEFDLDKPFMSIEQRGFLSVKRNIRVRFISEGSWVHVVGLSLI